MFGVSAYRATRKLKKALESFWSGKSTGVDLHYTAAELRSRNWCAMKQAGIDHIPVGDFSLYDHMLDMAVAVGAVPERYQCKSRRRLPTWLMRLGWPANSLSAQHHDRTGI